MSEAAAVHSGGVGRSPPEAPALPAPAPHKKFRRQTRKKLGIGGLLSILVSAFIAGFGGVAAYLATSNLYREKSTDVWAILYLEMEREVRVTERRLAKTVYADRSVPLNAEVLAAAPPSAVVEAVTVDGKTSFSLASGWLGRKPKLDALEAMVQNGGGNRFQVSVHAGRPYLARTEPGEGGSTHVYLWKLEADTWFANAAAAADGIVVYVVTQDGQLVFSSDKTMTPLSLGTRDLVKAFVREPLSRGQLEVDTDAGRAYGMFHQIGESNLILFEEIPRSVVMHPVRSMVVSFAATLLGVFTIGLLLLQLPLLRLVRPLRQLAGLAEAVGRGDMTPRPVDRSFGEVKLLSDTFKSMIDGLVKRDEKIARFIEEQKEAVRLQGELKVAQGIQDALLPKAVSLDGSGLALASHYSPAAECAGDWYSYAYDQESGDVVIAIADVSGHGAGSAMYTAVIAGLFEEARIRGLAAFEPLEFFARLNKVMIRMGRRQWHSTFTVVRYRRGGETVRIANAGGTPVYLIDANSGAPKAKLEMQPSDLIGLADEATFAEKEVALPKGVSLFLYTDGLTEANSETDQMYGKKKLRKALEASGHQPPAAMINRVLGDWNAHRGTRPPDDDVCLIAFRRS